MSKLFFYAAAAGWASECLFSQFTVSLSCFVKVDCYSTELLYCVYKCTGGQKHQQDHVERSRYVGRIETLKWTAAAGVCLFVRCYIFYLTNGKQH